MRSILAISGLPTMWKPGDVGGRARERRWWPLSSLVLSTPQRGDYLNGAPVLVTQDPSPGAAATSSNRLIASSERPSSQHGWAGLARVVKADGCPGSRPVADQHRGPVTVPAVPARLLVRRGLLPTLSPKGNAATTTRSLQSPKSSCTAVATASGTRDDPPGQSEIWLFLRDAITL